MRELEADINELAKRLESLESWVSELEQDILELKKVVKGDV